MSHTPGPWKVIDGVVYIANAVIVQHAAEFGKHVETEERDANARLIAAAPELLDALIDVSNAYQKMFDVMPAAWQTYDHIVNAAIAKATGQ